ncbi:acetyl/propionyl/methylcrotonyl-CoA carboxylase subunit alpha [soil metagenome]
MSEIRTIKKILIANRGEIAIRVMRTCKDMGIGTVAVFSDADEHSLFVKYADEAVRIGGHQPSESYLVMDKIIEAARRTHADAIHPGYGFLSENAAFATKCQEAGFIFIGPKPSAIDALGDKKRSKQLVQQFNVPTVPGYDGDDQSLENLIKQAEKVGFPLLLKASAGGGGKGMRIVRESKNLQKDIEGAKREALSSFGNDVLLIERYFEDARHIEFQVFGDKHGNTIHLFERDCSIQRRYQKIIEESPSPALTPVLRARMAEAAVNAAKSVGYDNAGTVEFILDKKGDFYFLEVNTRLQVEHPVTEAITGLDLVRLQIEVAEGKPLPFNQQEITASGHAIECRIYAEDPYNNYLPVTGTIRHFLPYVNENMRYDTGVVSDSVIDVFYDPMIAKVIAKGIDRADALRIITNALRKTVLSGLTTNKGFLIEVLNDASFATGDFDTRYLENHPELTQPRQPSEAVLAESAVAAMLFNWNNRSTKRQVLRSIPSGWRNSFYKGQVQAYTWKEQAIHIEYRYVHKEFKVKVAGQEATVKLVSSTAEQLVLEWNGLRQRFTVSFGSNSTWVHHPTYGELELKEVSRYPEAEVAAIPGTYRAPMPGQVVKILVKPGDSVLSGDSLLVINSMKMENTIEAFEDGTVEEVYVEAKGFIEAETLLLKINKN